MGPEARTTPCPYRLPPGEGRGEGLWATSEKFDFFTASEQAHGLGGSEGSEHGAKSCRSRELREVSNAEPHAKTRRGNAHLWNLRVFASSHEPFFDEDCRWRLK